MKRIAVLSGFVLCLALWPWTLNERVSLAAAAPSTQVKLADNVVDEIRRLVKKFYPRLELTGISVQGAAEGKVSVGVVVREADDNSEIVLDVQPCKGHVEVFSKPYEKTDTRETVECDGKTFKKTRVKQKKAN